MGAIRGHDIRLHNIKVLGQDQFIRGETSTRTMDNQFFMYLQMLNIIHWALR